MPDVIYQWPDTVIFLFMMFVTVSFSLLFIVINKRFKFYLLSYKNNGAIASVASLIGIVYGVLAGYLCIYLLSNQDHAVKAALDEGTAAANLYRQTQWLSNPIKNQIQNELKQYIDLVVKIEWPKMTHNKDVSTRGDLYITNMSDQLSRYSIHNQTELIAVNAVSREISALYKGRQERIEMSGAQLSTGIWIVMLLNTFLIIVINYAFRMNFKLHLFSLAAFATMASSVLFLLVTLDRPFQGEFIVEPDALMSVLTLMKQ